MENGTKSSTKLKTSEHMTDAEKARDILNRLFQVIHNLDKNNGAEIKVPLVEWKIKDCTNIPQEIFNLRQTDSFGSRTIKGSLNELKPQKIEMLIGTAVCTTPQLIRLEQKIAAGQINNIPFSADPIPNHTQFIPIKSTIGSSKVIKEIASLYEVFKQNTFSSFLETIGLKPGEASNIAENIRKFVNSPEYANLAATSQNIATKIANMFIDLASKSSANLPDNARTKRPPSPNLDQLKKQKLPPCSPKANGSPSNLGRI